MKGQKKRKQELTIHQIEILTLSLYTKYGSIKLKESIALLGVAEKANLPP